MSKINFRLYGDQIYGLSNKYLQEYINPEINKEEFLTSFKNGSLNLKITGIKKPINIIPQISIKDMNCEKIDISIPDENSNLKIKISKFRIMLIIKELTEEEIYKLLINKRQKLIKKFIKETIKNIEKKEKSTFLEGLLDSLLKSALNGLDIEFNDIEIYLKCENFLFLVKIEKIIYNEKEGIKLININLLFNDKQNTNNKCEIIKNLGINILLKEGKDNNNNEIDINIINMNLGMNVNAYKGIIHIVQIFKDNNYELILTRYKKLIDYNKPKKINDKKLYYKLLWFWAIKTVIKLQKYKTQEKFYIFDLIDSSQDKYAKKYLTELNKDFDVNENFKDFDCIILPDEIKLLKTTKDLVEKQLLENKKGNQLANAFNFFFGGGDDNKNELTDEEKQSLNEAYSDEGIIKFLINKKEYIENNSQEEEKTIDKIKNYFNKISYNFTINNTEILLNDLNSKHSIYIKNIKVILDINKYAKATNYLFSLSDIGYDLKNSFLNNKSNDNTEAIKFIKSNDIYEISFGFKNFDINEKITLFLINFYFSFYYIERLNSNRNKFFIKSKYKNKNKNTENVFNIIDKIKISNIPCINFVNDIDKISISININNFTMNKTSINCGLNIKDNKSSNIIDNLGLNLIKNEENTKFELLLNNKINIIFPPYITNWLFSFYWQIQKLKQYHQIIEFIENNTKLNNENKILLYSFHYKIYKTLKQEQNFLDNLNIKFVIKNLTIFIQEKTHKTIIFIANLTLNYNKNRNILFQLGTFQISTYKSCILFISLLKLKSPEITQYINSIENKIKNDFNLNLNDDVLNQNIKMLKDSVTNDFIYQKYYGKIINQLINVCKIYITEIKINFKSDEHIFLLNINRTFGEKNKNIFNFNTESSSLNYTNDKNSKNLNTLMEIKEKINFDYDFMLKKMTIKAKSPKFNINGDIIKYIKESFNFKIDKNRLRGLLKKNEVMASISNTIILFNKFIFNIANINIQNSAKFITNSVFVTIDKFIMRRSDNKSGFILFKEKEFKLSYEHRNNNKKDKLINVKSTEINVMLSQEDLYFLILYIANIYYNSKPPEKDKSKKKVVSSANKTNNLEINFILPNVNLNLCENNNYRKVGELLLVNTNFKINSFYEQKNKNINGIISQEFIKQNNYSILINKILLKYNDINNNEIVLLKSGQDNNNQTINHIELYCVKDEAITININKNNIILRGDSFYALYNYFQKAIPLDEIKQKAKTNNNNNKLSKITYLQFNFDFTKFLIPSTFNADENLCFKIEKFIVIFNSINQSKFPIGNFGIKLSSISGLITNENNSRKLFYTKNEEFLSVKINYIDKKLNLKVNLDTLIINLSYTDISTFLRVYYLNEKLIEKEKKLITSNKTTSINPNLNQLNLNDNNLIRRNSYTDYFQNIIEKSVLFSGSFNFQNFNITLIDNSSGSYYPFGKLELTKINLDCRQDNTINSYFSLLLLSYNYISCVWEPTIEKIFIQFSYDEKNQLKSKNFQIIIDKMNINISDMSISFTLNSLNNWIKKLIEEQKNLKNNNNNNININTINNLIDFKSTIIYTNNELKITNNKLLNYTGIKLYIKYAKKEYICEPFESIELEYINEWDINKYGPKQISLALNTNNNYDIPIEKICTRLHRINNVSYIVSENILSKERQININVYSPIIFKNKSLYQLQLNIFSKKGNAQYFLDKNSIIGLPLFYYEPNTFFNFKLIDSNYNSTSINFSIDEIVNIKADQIYKKNIIIDRTILLMNLNYKIPNVKTIIIGCEYMIINCLPCNIGLTAKGNNYIIEKCSQQYIDFYTGNDSEISIQITANNTTFFSRPKKLFQKVPKENGNFLKFKNANNSESFRLSLLIKKKENKKIIIIYAESILDNKSGIDFQIYSKNICFSLTKNLYLISSKVNMKESFFTLNNTLYRYNSKNIYFKDIIHSSPSYFLDLKSTTYPQNQAQNQIQLIIENTISNINLKDSEISKYNIITMIYRIHSLYRITSLLSTKNFVIASQENPGEYIIIQPMSQSYFNFFHKGQTTPLIFSVNNLSNNNGFNNNEYNYGKFTTSFRFLQIGTYSFTVGDTKFNLEIRKSSSKGIIDVFVTETNFNNAKIIIDNLTNNIFNVYQRNFQSFNQIIESNKKEILNIYDQNFLKFTLQYDNNKSLDFEFIPSEIQEKQINLGNNIILWLESNGIKMKLSFFYKSYLDQNKNFSINTNYNFSIKINEILTSIIGDNEPKSKNLRNYQRKEILLLDINNLYLEIRLDENQGILGKDVLKTNFTFNNLCLYNQSQENLKFINALNNDKSPCISLRNEIYHFKNDNVWKIKGFGLNMANLRVNIDPVFVEELMDFINNIIYRMKIKNYNVDKIFLITDDVNKYDKGLNLNKYQDKIKEYIKSYNEKGLLFHGTNFELPQLELVFQISKLGLEHLLLNKFGFSSFFIWTAKGLTEKKHSINLEPYTIPLYIGDFKGILKKIIQRYKSAVISEFVTIGIKGVIGNISKAINKKVGKKVLKFINNALNKNQNNDLYESDDDEDNNNNNYLMQYNERKRIQRAFYGKFKYFKEFNQDHAYYFDIIPKRLSNLSMNFIFLDLLKGNNNNLYVFTNISLILMTTNLEVYNIIYYFYVAEVKWDKNMVYIRYNQTIDGNNYFQFKEQNEMLASLVAKKLDDISKNKDDFNDV